MISTRCLAWLCSCNVEGHLTVEDLLQVLLGVLNCCP
jgi:hypothetical protein